MSEIAVEVRVTGWVQGVSFRWACREEADRHDVRGWVRNEPDGSVHAHLEGPVDDVQDLVSWCGHGPPAARVEAVRTADVEPIGARSFETG
jgi:acylphosphatase